MDRYVVMGNPIAHSKSPAIHARFAEQTGQSIVYERMLVPLEGFREAVSAFRREGGRGANVTVPFKHEAWAVCDRLSPRAQTAGAVNTLALHGSEIYGDNTDGIGLVRDLRDNNAVPLGGRRVLVVGAGGAVRGLLPALIAEGPRSIHLANRTAAKAHELAASVGAKGLIGGGFEVLREGPFDVVINAISAGLTGEIPALPEGLMAPGAAGYDLVYADEPTAFVRWARAHGAAVALDGLGMLVEQAAAAFHLWRGVRPDTAPVIAALRSGIAHA